MKKLGMLSVMVLVLGIAATSCSSKETRSEEPVISGSTGDSAPADTNVAAANLGSSSSGQGR